MRVVEAAAPVAEEPAAEEAVAPAQGAAAQIPAIRYGPAAASASSAALGAQMSSTAAREAI